MYPPASALDAASARTTEAQTATRVAQVLAAALQRLPAGDRLLLRLRFAQGLAVPAIAETMHMSRKALYERTQELTRQLRRELRSAGIAARDVGELLADRLNGPMWDDLVAGSTADVEDEQDEGGVGRRES